jgi:hypothetical protein
MNFVSLKNQKISQNKNALFNEQTASLCRVIVSLVFTGILWVSLHGWQYGLLALFITAIAFYVVILYQESLKSGGGRYDFTDRGPFFSHHHKNGCSWYLI